MAGIAGILGRFSSVVKRRKLNDGSLKGGGALRRRKPNTHTAGRKSQSSQWGGEFNPFFMSVYVDDYLQVRVQHSYDDTTALIVPALIAQSSLGSDHVRLFGSR